uniref:Uncharacterized protein n=1 Tax=Arundo donax TaxID=35708 RepID=A0A0A8XSN5_ARUDO
MEVLWRIWFRNVTIQLLYLFSCVPKLFSHVDF